MARNKLSRRSVLQGTGALAGSSLARLGITGIIALSDSACVSRDDGANFETLSETEATEFEAIAARILPTTDTPGAREAGVIYFIDKAFASFEKKELGNARSGLSEFQQGIEGWYPGTTLFSQLQENEQDDYLKTRVNSAFFAKMRFLTLAGFFGMSSHGGNRDNVGWDLLGFDGHRGVWNPPFGYYDADYTEEQQNGE